MVNLYVIRMYANKDERINKVLNVIDSLGNVIFIFSVNVKYSFILNNLLIISDINSPINNPIIIDISEELLVLLIIYELNIPKNENVQRDNIIVENLKLFIFL